MDGLESFRIERTRRGMAESLVWWLRRRRVADPGPGRSSSARRAPQPRVGRPRPTSTRRLNQRSAPGLSGSSPPTAPSLLAVATRSPAPMRPARPPDRSRARHRDRAGAGPPP